VFGQLGLMQEMRNRLLRLDPACQVVLRRHRVDLAGVETRTRADLARELPEDVTLAGRWLDGLQTTRGRLDLLLDPPPLVPFERGRELRQWRARLKAAELDVEGLDSHDLGAGLPEGHTLAAIGRAAIHFLTPLASAPVAGPGPQRLMSLLTDGIWVVQGGRAGLRKTFMQRLKTYGVTVLDESPPRRLTPGWWSDLVVDTEKEPIGAHVVLYADDARTLPSLLPPSSKRERLEDLVDDAREVARRRVLHVRARPPARPAGLGPLTVVNPQDGGEPVLVRTVQQGDECLFALVFDDPLDPDPAQPPARARALDVLRWVVPFLDDHLLAAPSEQGQGVPIYKAPPSSQDGGLTLLPHRTPFRQVFLVGHQVVPALGLEGEFLAGTACAELVQRQVKRKDILGK